VADLGGGRERGGSMCEGERRLGESGNRERGEDQGG
jgi:hypothetical protein